MDNLEYMCKVMGMVEESLKKKPVMLCFRCEEAITDDFYVHTLSNEYAHTYCQARGIRKPAVKQVTEE
jgi:hypothetical protein